VIGPAISKDGQSGTIPTCDRRPAAGFNPTRPFHAAGTRTDPPVSLPTAAAARPCATEAAAPEDEPKAKVIDLMDALKKSLGGDGEKKSTKRKPAKKKKAAAKKKTRKKAAEG